MPVMVRRRRRRGVMQPGHEEERSYERGPDGTIKRKVKRKVLPGATIPRGEGFPGDNRSPGTGAFGRYLRTKYGGYMPGATLPGGPSGQPIRNRGWYRRSARGRERGIGGPKPRAGRPMYPGLPGYQGLPVIPGATIPRGEGFPGDDPLGLRHLLPAGLAGSDDATLPSSEEPGDATLPGSPSVPSTNEPIAGSRPGDATVPGGSAPPPPPEWTLPEGEWLPENPQLPAHPLGAYTDPEFEANRALAERDMRQQYHDLLRQLGYRSEGGDIVRGTLDVEAERQRTDLNRLLGLAGQESTNRAALQGNLWSGAYARDRAMSEEPYVTSLADLERELPGQQAELRRNALGLLSGYNLDLMRLVAEAAQRRAQQFGEPVGFNLGGTYG